MIHRAAQNDPAVRIALRQLLQPLRDGRIVPVTLFREPRVIAPLSFARGVLPVAVVSPAADADGECPGHLLGAVRGHHEEPGNHAVEHRDDHRSSALKRGDQLGDPGAVVDGDAGA